LWVLSLKTARGRIDLGFATGQLLSQVVVTGTEPWQDLGSIVISGHDALGPRTASSPIR
jgi:hypothetical protein